MIKRLIMTVVAVAATWTCAMAESHEERKVNGKFTAIEVNKGANVSIVQSDKEGIEVITDGCPTSDVLTELDGSVLVVKMKTRTQGSAVQVLVNVKDLEKVTVRRGASVDTDGTFTHKGKFTLDVGAKCEVKMDIDVDELNVEGSTCVIFLEGSARKQNVVVTGTLGEASYDAKELESEDVTIKAVNTDAVVKFSNSLNAQSFACSIRYIGDSSKVTKSGTGDVLKY